MLKEILTKDFTGDKRKGFESADAEAVLFAGMELGRELGEIANESMPEELVADVNDAVTILAIVKDENGFESDDQDIVDGVASVLKGIAARYDVKGFEAGDKKSVMEKGKAIIKSVIEAIKAFFVSVIERGKNLLNGFDAYAPILTKKVEAYIKNWDKVVAGAEKAKDADINSGDVGTILIAGKTNTYDVALVLGSLKDAMKEDSAEKAFGVVKSIELKGLTPKADFNLKDAKLIGVSSSKLTYLLLEDGKLVMKYIDIKAQERNLDVNAKAIAQLKAVIKNSNYAKGLLTSVEFVKKTIKERNKVAKEVTAKADKSNAEYLSYIKGVKIPLSKASDKTIATVYSSVKANVALFAKLEKLSKEKEGE